MNALMEWSSWKIRRIVFVSVTQSFLAYETSIFISEHFLACYSRNQRSGLLDCLVNLHVHFLSTMLIKPNFCLEHHCAVSDSKEAWKE